MLMYRLGLFIYHCLLVLAVPFNPKAKLWVKGRKNLFQKLEKAFEKNIGKVIWFHAASLGEFEQGRPLIETVKKKYPQKKILVTFFSPSGYEIRKNYEGADFIFYLPLDSKKNAKNFLEIVKPSMAIFIKYEFWFYYLTALKKRKIPTYLVAGIFRKNQLFFKPCGGLFRKMLKTFTHIFVQNENSKQLLDSLSCNMVTVAGDTRFERVFQIVKENKELPFLQEFTQHQKIMICGSTWPADEKNIVRWINESNNLGKFIIAPHEIGKQHLFNLTKELKKPFLFYSEATPEKSEKSRVLIIDSIGKLSALYKYGDWAYIGGGFGAGIHNILEPAAFGLPVIFGPNYNKFQEAKDLKEINSAFSYKTYSELALLLNKFFSNPEFIKETSQKSKKYVYNNKGSVKIIIKKMFHQ